MFFTALATDYDGTIAENGVVDAPTLAALTALKESGRRLILVTGRELPSLREVFPEFAIFDRIVAENGALLHVPATQEERPLAPEPDQRLVAYLREREVAPLSVGRSIIATWRPHETAVLDGIGELGLELQITFNKGAVMVLPSGVNKATGLAHALTDLGMSAVNTVGIGDAENDHAFLKACGAAVAVSNAIESLKEAADLVTENARGAGVAELIGKLVEADGDAVPQAIRRRMIALGRDRRGGTHELRPDRGALLVVGHSGSGKSTLATSLLEGLATAELQACVFDPEGDYAELQGTIAMGDPKAPPAVAEIATVLEKTSTRVAVNMLAIPLADRPAAFAACLASLGELRMRTGRPHWIVVDEAHHIFPAKLDKAAEHLPQSLGPVIFITVEPKGLAPQAVGRFDMIIALGDDAPRSIRSFAGVVGDDLDADLPTPARGEALLWRKHSQTVHLLTLERPSLPLKRHRRKYAEGKLGDDKSFRFRGPDGKLDLKARNLASFIELGAGVDEATWLFHLERGEYSQWVREMIKDDELADEIEAVEGGGDLDAQLSRTRIRELIEKRYTAPAVES